MTQGERNSVVRSSAGAADQRLIVAEIGFEIRRPSGCKWSSRFAEPREKRFPLRIVAPFLSQIAYPTASTTSESRNCARVVA
jgi:hypothetical protein